MPVKLGKGDMKLFRHNPSLMKPAWNVAAQTSFFLFQILGSNLLLVMKRCARANKPGAALVTSYFSGKQVIYLLIATTGTGSGICYSLYKREERSTALKVELNNFECFGTESTHCSNTSSALALRSWGKPWFQHRTSSNLACDTDTVFSVTLLLVWFVPQHFIQRSLLISADFSI